jgi:hypothetical protein
LAGGFAIENDPESKLRMKLSFSGMASPDPAVLTFFGKFTTGGHVKTLIAFKPTDYISLVHTSNFNMSRFNLTNVDMGVGLIFNS